MTVYDRIKAKREELGMSQQELANRVGYKSRSAVNKIELGTRDINQSKIKAFASALQTTPAYLMGWENNDGLREPTIAEKVISFPVIGQIAAGYNEFAFEDWTGDTVEIPVSYLNGRRQSEFFVLTVHGDSMYPLYMDGDNVLILKQTTLNRSGEIGAVLYNDECATLKKVEYIDGEDWIKLIPINPEYRPLIIKDEELDHCHIIGLPYLLIREIKE